MANELQASGGAARGLTTAYFAVGDGAGRVWNGTAFAAYSNAGRTAGAIAATDRGDGVYVADRPAGMASGVYVVALCLASAAPVTTHATQTDALLAGPGVDDLSGALVAASAAAALDLADGIETGVTLRQATRLMAAALAGRCTHAGTSSEQYDAVGNPGTARIVGNFDSRGNGTPSVTP